jgi:ABC-type enterobactin transport system permease subunit
MNKKRLFYILLFAVLTLAALVFSIINGTLEFSIGDIAAAFVGRCEDPLAQQIIINVRLPRTLIALLDGAYGVAGPCYKGYCATPWLHPKSSG